MWLKQVQIILRKTKLRCDSSSDEPGPLRAPLGVWCPTHAACSAWLHSAGESFFTSFSALLLRRIGIPPRLPKKEKGLEKAPTHKDAPLTATSSSRPGLPPTSPPQPVNSESSRSVTVPPFVPTSPPSVQQCPLPPATAFPHLQRSRRRAATETPELGLTSAHLLWLSSERWWRRLADTGGTDTALMRWNSEFVDDDDNNNNGYII